MNLPEDVEIDDVTADIAEDDTQEQQAYPTSGTRQVEGEEVKIAEEDEDMAQWAGKPSVKGSTESMRMALLTFSLIGLQYVH